MESAGIFLPNSSLFSGRLVWPEMQLETSSPKMKLANCSFHYFFVPVCDSSMWMLSFHLPLSISIKETASHVLNQASPSFHRDLVDTIVAYTWNSKLFKMYLDYIWICYSGCFTKAEKLLSLY